MDQVQEDSISFCVECYVCKVRVYCSKYFDQLKFAIVDKLFRGFFPNFVHGFIFGHTRCKPSYFVGACLPHRWLVLCSSGYGKIFKGVVGGEALQRGRARGKR